MMLQLFDVQDKRVVPNANTYLIPELAVIMEQFPDDYLNVLAYIFFTTCPDGSNPYVNMDESQKEEVILADIKPKFSLEEVHIVNAIEKCKKLYETPVLRTFLGAKKMLDKIGRFLDSEEITTGKDGNSTEIRGMLKELSTYWENYNKLENVLKEEQAKVRGGAKMRYDQLPNYIDSKAEKHE